MTLLQLEHLVQCFVLEAAACCNMSWEQELSDIVYSLQLFKLCVQTHLTDIPLGTYFVLGTGQGIGAHRNNPTIIFLIIMYLLYSAPKLAHETNHLLNTSKQRLILKMSFLRECS